MSSSGNRNISRGKSFSIEEDIILCNAWIEISQDPIHGNNQKKDKLWSRISEVFENLRPNNDQ